MYSLLLYFSFLVTLSHSIIKIQCPCDGYLKCTKGKRENSFKGCIRMCKTDVYQGHVGFPESYARCLIAYNHPITRMMSCIRKNIGNGCNADSEIPRVIQYRNFTTFEELVYTNTTELMQRVGVTYDFKTKRMRKFHSCLLNCIYPSSNKCTKKLKCGLLTPEDDQMFFQLKDCANKTDVTRGIILELGNCMRQVVHTVEPVIPTTEEPVTLIPQEDEEEESDREYFFE